MQAIKNKSHQLRILLRNYPLRTLQLASVNARYFTTTNAFSQSRLLQSEFQTHQESRTAFQTQIDSQTLQQRPKKSDIQYACKGALPIDRAGTHALPKLPDRYFVKEYYESKKMTEDVLVSHFNSMFDSFLENVAKRNYNGLEKIMEKRFYEKLLGQKETLDKFEFNYKQNNEGEKNSYLIDSMIVKGVYHDRQLNDTNHDYYYIDKHENIGIRFYLHKYFVGFSNYYMMLKNKAIFDKTADLMKKENADIVELLNNQDDFRDTFFRQKKAQETKSHSLVLRVTFLCNNQGKLVPISGPESLYDGDYSGNHIIIFENQLKTPNTLTLIDHTFQEFINLHKLNFSNWKIVDIDHYMKGNPFFNKFMTEGEWFKDFENTCGTHKERHTIIKNDKQFADLKTTIEAYENFLNFKEPKSLRGIEKIYQQQDVDIKKKQEAMKAASTKKEKKGGEKAAGDNQENKEQKPTEGKEAKKSEKQPKENKGQEDKAASQ